MKTTGVMGIAGYTLWSAARKPSSPRKWCAGSWQKLGLWSGSRAGEKTEWEMSYRHHGIHHPYRKGLSFPNCGLFWWDAAILDGQHDAGCCSDNSACEGLFGHLKNEMFYNRGWTKVNVQKFIDILNKYLTWYNEKRIKISLRNMSPLEYRRDLELAV